MDHSMSRKNESLDVAAEELNAAGVPFEVSAGGKHLHIRFRSFVGDPQLIIVSKNGDSNGFGHFNWTRGMVRRKLHAPKNAYRDQLANRAAAAGGVRDVFVAKKRADKNLKREKFLAEQLKNLRERERMARWYAAPGEGLRDW
jgi:hypothetical protein